MRFDVFRTARGINSRIGFYRIKRCLLSDGKPCGTCYGRPRAGFGLLLGLFGVSLGWDVPIHPFSGY